MTPALSSQSGCDYICFQYSFLPRRLLKTWFEFEPLVSELLLHLSITVAHYSALHFFRMEFRNDKDGERQNVDALRSCLFQGKSLCLNVTHKSGVVYVSWERRRRRQGASCYLLSPGCHIVKLHHLLPKLLEAVGQVLLIGCILHSLQGLLHLSHTKKCWILQKNLAYTDLYSLFIVWLI